jgi:hypothetical protein
MAFLPVSGLEVALRHPDGSDELVMRESTGSPVKRGLALLDRLAGGANVAALSVTDFEILLLHLRAQVLGERFDLGFACPVCQEHVEVAFDLPDYLADLIPRRPAGVTDTPDRADWRLYQGVAFRLPTAGDQAAVAGLADSASRLAERCIELPRGSARLRAKIEGVMSQMAPEVSRPLSGRCPACAASVAAPLYVTRLVVAELTRESASLDDEIDLIARAYHWNEADILRLPRRRRRAYADRIRQAA